jgi:ribonuclease III
MTARRAGASLRELEAVLGHRFARRSLLEEALTHPSVVGANRAPERRYPRTYERLEFLGDRVLALVAAHLLIEQFPTDAEGALTRRLNAMVRMESLATIGAKLGLERWVRVDASGLDVGGRPRPALLADCCEALIGAIYLDGGFAAAREFVLAHWTSMIEVVQSASRDAKTGLQEFAHAQGLEPPAYRIVETEGPAHAMTFTVEVCLSGQPPQQAVARSKRAAEHAAAALMLARAREAGDG